MMREGIELYFLIELFHKFFLTVFHSRFVVGFTKALTHKTKPLQTASEVNTALSPVSEVEQ